MLFKKIVKDRISFKKIEKKSRFKFVTNIREILLGLLGHYDDAKLQGFDELTLGYLDDKE